VENYYSDRLPDELIMGEILGLSSDEQLQVYRAVLDTVKSRLEKAKSVDKKRKSKEGIDIDALVKIVLEKIGGTTLGRYYKEEILPLKPLSTRTLPKGREDVRIVQKLFDWYLHIGRKHIKRLSELEARYLKVWAEVGVGKIRIPKDQKHLKVIVPKPEKLKAGIDQTVNSYLNSIIDPKVRRKIGHEVWKELVL